ncbi:hypothetical protein AB1N83_013400, partial [Pleurotus pulmonarius]
CSTWTARAMLVQRPLTMRRKKRRIFPLKKLSSQRTTTERTPRIPQKIQLRSMMHRIPLLRLVIDSKTTRKAEERLGGR